MKGNSMQPTATIVNRMADPDFGFDGTTFRAARLARRLSQAKLATSLGITNTYLKMLERGQRRPSIELIGRMEDVLQARPEEFGVTGLPPRVVRPAA